MTIAADHQPVQFIGLSCRAAGRATVSDVLVGERARRKVLRRGLPMGESHGGATIAADDILGVDELREPLHQELLRP